jgi:hypothetical protein
VIPTAEEQQLIDAQSKIKKLTDDLDEAKGRLIISERLLENAEKDQPDIKKATLPLRQEIDVLREKLLDAQKAHAQAQLDKIALNKAFEEADKRLFVTKEKLETELKVSAALIREKRELEAKKEKEISDLQDTINGMEIEAKDIQKQLAEAKREEKKVKEQLHEETKNAEDSLDKAEEEYKTLEKQMNEQLTEADKRIDVLQKEVERLKTSQSFTTSVKDQATGIERKEAKRLSDENNTQKAALERLLAENKSNKIALEQTDIQYRMMEQQLRKSTETIQQQTERITELEQKGDDEKLTDCVKANEILSANNDELKDENSTLAEKLQTCTDAYEQAKEETKTALQEAADSKAKAEDVTKTTKKARKEWKKEKQELTNLTNQLEKRIKAGEQKIKEVERIAQDEKSAKEKLSLEYQDLETEHEQEIKQKTNSHNLIVEKLKDDNKGLVAELANLRNDFAKRTPVVDSKSDANPITLKNILDDDEDMQTIDEDGNQFAVDRTTTAQIRERILELEKSLEDAKNEIDEYREQEQEARECRKELKKCEDHEKKLLGELKEAEQKTEEIKELKDLTDELRKEAEIERQKATDTKALLLQIQETKGMGGKDFKSALQSLNAWIKDHKEALGSAGQAIQIQLTTMYNDFVRCVHIIQKLHKQQPLCPNPMHDKLMADSTTGFAKLNALDATYIFMMCQEHFWSHLLSIYLGQQYHPFFPLYDQVVGVFGRTVTDEDLKRRIRAVVVVFAAFGAKKLNGLAAVATDMKSQVNIDELELVLSHVKYLVFIQAPQTNHGFGTFFIPPEKNETKLTKELISDRSERQAPKAMDIYKEVVKNDMQRLWRYNAASAGDAVIPIVVWTDIFS